MYISAYGLTNKRVYPSAFMIFLAVTFLLIILKQFMPNKRIMTAIVVTFLIIFILVSVLNIDGIIANYNVDKYLSGSINDPDCYHLSELGPSSTKALLRLYHECTDEEVVARARETLQIFAEDMIVEKNSNIFFFLNIPRARAYSLLQQNGFIR